MGNNNSYIEVTFERFMNCLIKDIEDEISDLKRTLQHTIPCESYKRASLISTIQHLENLRKSYEIIKEEKIFKIVD